MISQGIIPEKVTQQGSDVLVERSFKPKVLLIPREQLIDEATGETCPEFARHQKILRNLNWNKGLIFKRIIPSTEGGLAEGSMQAL